MSTTIQTTQNEIARYFSVTKETVFRIKQLREIFSQNRENWGLKTSETFTGFSDFLQSSSILRKVQLDFPNRNETLYVMGDTSIYSVLMLISPNTCLSHYSAMFIHQLTEQIPKTIYINTEQSPKNQGYGSQLSQESIDAAFSRKPRETKNKTIWEGITIVHLNGKNSGNLGVVEIDAPETGRVRVTNIERTLIDCVVRPAYAGGIFEVFEAFKKAKDLVSANKMKAYLKQLNHKYPYHQAIGFLMDRAGYSDSQLKLFANQEKQFDFYLDYQMGKYEYDKNWRINYPAGL